MLFLIDEDVAWSHIPDISAMRLEIPLGSDERVEEIPKIGFLEIFLFWFPPGDFIRKVDGKVWVCIQCGSSGATHFLIRSEACMFWQEQKLGIELGLRPDDRILPLIIGFGLHWHSRKDLITLLILCHFGVGK